MRRYVIYPAESGTPLIEEFVLRTFGTANWTQFCPGSDAPESRGSMVGETELSFFVAWMDVRAGSLTSTYRVVRKYNFKS